MAILIECLKRYKVNGRSQIYSIFAIGQSESLKKKIRLIKEGQK